MKKTDYEPPEWAGAPAPPLRGSSEVALELVVKGEVQRRVPLDVQAYDSFLIGRAKNCDVVLDGLEPQSSRFHCVLQCKEGSAEIYVYDLGSSHGTLLNGQRLDPRSYTPMKVGEQLKFCGDKPASCIAILCGPEEAMGEESEVDLTAFREQTAKEREESLKAQQTDLQKRKDAKRQRMSKEAQQKATIQVLAATAQQRTQELKEEKAKDRKKLHEVTWGMGADAVEAPSEDRSEEVQKLMDDHGRLDFELVRKRTLTEKQEQLVTKAEQRKRRVTNLLHEKERLEELLTSAVKRKAEADLDIDEEKPLRGGGASAEKLQGVENKLEKADEDLLDMANNILLSLGLRKPSDAIFKLSKRKAALYDTRLNDDDDDDYFDRTATKKTAASGPSGEAMENVPTELRGLPTFDGVETLASLELKSGLLQAERGRLGAQWAGEVVRERSRLAKEAAGGNQEEEEEEDLLDQYMSSTRAELREDRRGKIRRRMAAVDARLQEASKMLRVARKNADPLEMARAKTGLGSSSTPGTESTKESAKADVASAMAAAAASAAASAAAFSAAAVSSTAAAPDATPGGAAPPAASEGGAAREVSESATADADAQPAKPLQKAKRGPERPPAAVLAQAAPADADADAQAARVQQKVKRGPERPTAAMLAQAEADAKSAAAAAAKHAAEAEGGGAAAPPASAPAAASQPAAAPKPAGEARQLLPSRPEPAKGLINPTKGGLQLLQAPGKQNAADPSAMPPPAAKKRKIYGVAMPPPGAAAAAAAAARDASMEASGETEEE